MINIKKPRIEFEADMAKLSAEIVIDERNISKHVWVTVSRQYAEYLCVERSDAFLILVLPLAMQYGYDIYCEVPVTGELLFKINNYFIPILSEFSNNLYKINIIAKSESCMENKGAVGTGCSCGIDSFHAIHERFYNMPQLMRLTHLCIYNLGIDGKFNQQSFEVQKKRAQIVADEIGLSLVVCDSNCSEMVPIKKDFNYLHTYIACFIVLSMQKLWGNYFYASSGYKLDWFSVRDADRTDCARYDLLTLNCFSTKNMTFFSEGMAFDRFEKTKHIYKDEIVKKYLHVCNNFNKNCSVCPKCKRTILALYALGELNQYKDVFNVEYFNNHKNEYFMWLYKRHYSGDVMTKEIYEILKNEPYFEKEKQNDTVWKNFSYIDGLYDDGWMGEQLRVKFAKKKSLRIKLYIYIADLIGENNLTIWMDEEKIQSNHLILGMNEISLDMDDIGKNELRLQFDKVVIPSEINGGEDIRGLSAILSRVE